MGFGIDIQSGDLQIQPAATVIWHLKTHAWPLQQPQRALCTEQHEIPCWILQFRVIQETKLQLTIAVDVWLVVKIRTGEEWVHPEMHERISWRNWGMW